jgi:hypothetical protein
VGIYDKEIASAKADIEAAGESVVWRSVGAAEDSTTPWRPTGVAVTESDVSILFTDEVTSYDKSGEVQTTVMKNCIMHAVDFEPSLKDFVVRGNKTLNVSKIRPLSPNGQTIMYYVDFTL